MGAAKVGVKPSQLVNVIWPDIEECTLSCFCMCMLMRFGRSLMSQLKGEPMVKGKLFVMSSIQGQRGICTVFNGRN